MAPLRIVSASLLGLAITASGASAECAWVLWSVPVSKDETFLPSRWQPIGAHATREACEAQRVRERSLQEPGERLLYRCLPDTVDPRGPKGK